MLNPAQCELIGYYEEGSVFHILCAAERFQDDWEDAKANREAEGEDHWGNASVSERFATKRDGELLIRYSIDEMEGSNLEAEIETLLSEGWGNLDELIQDHLDEVFHDAWDSEDFPTTYQGWQEVVSTFAYDNYEELGLGFVLCDQCSERIGG